MNISTPQTISTAGQSLIDANNALAGKLAIINEAMVELPIDYDSPLASFAGSSSITEAVRDILYKGVKIVAIHPWVYGAGEQGSGSYSGPNMAYLSPKNAVLHLSSKLKDQNDNSKDRAKELVYILLSADKLETFALQLDALSAVFPFVEIEFCLRRAIQLFELNETKFVRRSAFINPHWKDVNIAAVQKNIAAKLESLAAFNDASTADSDPVAELQEVVSEKISELNDINAAWEALNINHSSAATAGYFAGSASSLSEQAKSISANDSKKYTFLLAITANSAGDLTYFREALGI